MTTPYDDIINHPHHVSRNHPQMSMHDRAAQFSPFAALTGYEEAIAETARADAEAEDKKSPAKTTASPNAQFDGTEQAGWEDTPF